MRSETLKKRLVKGLERNRRALNFIGTVIFAELLQGLPVETKQRQRKKALVAELRSLHKQLVAISRRIGRAAVALEKLSTVHAQIHFRGCRPVVIKTTQPVVRPVVTREHAQRGGLGCADSSGARSGR
jgi:hypothetical protein